MKLSFVKFFTLSALICVIILQIIWTVNMYFNNTKALSTSIERVLDYAVLSEHSSRHEKAGGTISSTPMAINSLDTARYITKTIRTVDTTFTVTIE